MLDKCTNMIYEIIPGATLPEDNPVHTVTATPEEIAANPTRCIVLGKYGVRREITVVETGETLVSDASPNELRGLLRSDGLISFVCGNVTELALVATYFGERLPASFFERYENVLAVGWNSGNTQPTKIGVYERKNKSAGTSYSKWDGLRWLAMKPTVDVANRALRHSDWQHQPWRPSKGQTYAPQPESPVVSAAVLEEAQFEYRNVTVSPAQYPTLTANFGTSTTMPTPLTIDRLAAAAAVLDANAPPNDWTTGDVRPYHPGVYQRYIPSRPNEQNHFSKWTGSHWLMFSYEAADALACRTTEPSDHQNIPWRRVEGVSP